MIKLKSAREIELMVHGGKILAATLDLLRDAVRPGVTTHDLDRAAEDFIRSHEGATPAFKGLYGFPGSICSSINEEIVHGIPSEKRVLKAGDIVSIDCGVVLDGYYGDATGDYPDNAWRFNLFCRAALELLRAAGDAGMDRGYKHPEFGNRPLRALVEHIADHDIAHLRQIRGECGERQVPNIKFGISTGVGAVNYGKNFGCTAAAILGSET